MEHRKTRKTRMGKLKLAVINATYYVYHMDLKFQIHSTINSILITVHRKTRNTRMGKRKLALVTWFYSKQPTINFQLLSTFNYQL